MSNGDVKKPRIQVRKRKPVPANGADAPRGPSRRELFAVGAAASLGTLLLSGSRAAAQSAHPGADGITWDYEVDVVIIGAGATGLPAAIRALDLGASVMIVEQSFDAGGKALHSGGWTSHGGGDPIQLRDMNGQADPDGFVQVDPLVPTDALDDNVELAFRDKTDWSAVATDGTPRYRYNDKEMVRAWAENAPATRQLLLDNYVRFGRIDGTHRGGGVSRARAARTIMKLGDVTDIRAGIVSREDAGQAGVRSSHFSISPMGSQAGNASEGVVGNGASLQRPLEFSARQKGVQFLFNRHMDEIIREEQYSGRVLGVRASYTPVHNTETGARLESLWSNGNIDERRTTIHVRARKAVIIAAGGHEANPSFRSMFYPQLADSWYPNCNYPSMGGEGRGPDASGILAGLRIGAHLAGMGQNSPLDFSPSTRLGARSEVGVGPGHPAFFMQGATGLSVGAAGLEHLIYVDQVGKRWYNERRTNTRVVGPAWPGGPRQGTPDWRDYTPGDWRNCDKEWIRDIYERDDHDDAILAANEGSRGPKYLPGPKWAIFDQAAVDRAGWKVEEPIVSEKNGLFFKADTLQELAIKISLAPHSSVPMPYLQETVDRWNGFAESGFDEDFGRGTPMHPIGTPPFYAASHIMTWHDSNGGLRVNGKMQVIDVHDQVIPGLYAGGESSGGDIQHGLGRATVQGFIAGTNAAREPAVG
jgi:hypothetical protein